MANKIFKGVKFPGMDDYYVLPEANVSNAEGILTIEHGGTGASDAATARANLGAAPAGLLSATHYKTSKADFEAMLLDTFNAMEIGTVKMLQADLTSGDSTIPNGYWYITMGKRAAGIGYIEMTKTTGLSIRRDMMDSVWGEWTHASRLYANEYFITSLDETDAILTSIVNDLDTYGSRFIVFNYNGQLFGCTVYRGSGDYSWAHADSYTISHDYKMHRILYGGVWQPWEYENPPLVEGEEYRTTERWNGHPVYQKMVPLGTLPNASVVRYNNVATFNHIVDLRLIIKTKDEIDAANQHMAFSGMSSYGASTASIWAEEKSNLAVNTNSWDASNYIGFAIMKYVK